MVFSSIIFLLYFLPIFLLIYYASPRIWKNGIALLGSCVFYAWGEPSFFFLILFFLILDYYLVRMMYYAEGKRKKNLLKVVITLNLLNLFIHKYLMFVVFNIDSVLSLVGGGLPPVWIALPIGISFITFQKISYAVDVYRSTREPMDRFQDYGLYILFFPQLIAGPIIRFHEVADQIKDRSSNENIDNKLLGFYRLIIGLSKKVLIADPLGLFVDEVFTSLPQGLGMWIAWLGIIAYSFQIYFDFSGYSDMAIGMARMMGFKFPENFNFPYIAQSITEFWRRWHITLSSWMRDYLYIPLGGNRVSQKRLYINLWIVFLLSGLWHGASWTFVVWGAYHGAFLVMERNFLLKKMGKWPKTMRMITTYILVLIGWVFFRAETLGDALVYIGQMFSFQSGHSIAQPNSYIFLLLAIATLSAFMGAFHKIEQGVHQFLSQPKSVLAYSWQAMGIVILGLSCLASLYATDFSPFIYFRF